MICSAVSVLLLLHPALMAGVEKIAVQGLFKDKAVVAIDGKPRVLTAGQTSPEGVKLISSDSKIAVLEINGVRQSYELGSKISGVFKKSTAKDIVTIAPDSENMYHVNGSINGFQVSFVVDTGATLISMNKHVAKRIGLNYKLEGEKGMSYTASGVDRIYIMKLKKVKVGDIELRDVGAAIHHGDFPRVILLGNAFLSRVDMQRKGRLMQLSR